MTRNQLELIKKGTYFFLVLGLGGSVLWLSSGGNVFQSDVVGQPISINANENLNSNAATTGGLLGALDTSTNTSGSSISGTQNNTNTGTSLGTNNFLDTSMMNTNDSNIIYASAPAASETNLNVNSSSSTSGDFADLVQTAYTGEESDLYSSAYTAEETPDTVAPAPVKEETVKPAPQVVTTTQAQAPQSGPEDIFLIIAALTISVGVMYYKKFLKTE